MLSLYQKEKLRNDEDDEEEAHIPVNLCSPFRVCKFLLLVSIRFFLLVAFFTYCAILDSLPE